MLVMPPMCGMMCACMQLDDADVDGYAEERDQAMTKIVGTTMDVGTFTLRWKICVQTARIFY